MIRRTVLLNFVVLLFLRACSALQASAQTAYTPKATPKTVAAQATCTLKATPKTVAWGYYDAKTAPVLRVKPELGGPYTAKRAIL